MALSSEQVVDVLRAAGESTRLRILALLAAEELSVLELCRILDQSQPRVSRHLKLLAEAGLVERFPDGAWVFYRLAGTFGGGAVVASALALIQADDAVIRGDAGQLAAVRTERSAGAQAYFARNAARWNEIRSLYVDEKEVEAAILRATGEGPFDELVDLGAGAGRMLTLLGGRAVNALGLDLSQQMLNIARDEVAKAGLTACELRHGDIFDTGLPGGCADLVTVHQVLHYLGDPAAAVEEAARLVAPGGLLLIADFAPHDHEFLREAHQHRRLGFADDEILPWIEAAGLVPETNIALPPTTAEGLTVKIWTARRIGAALAERTAA
ncbi:ArsR/SmtB family transcription factor [Caulobacter endophyticus]|uniref:ArsR/SmtB family transcription factor n=1 Tax=Caulobacter endophyticus TaxID=2172652 RepID=UPI00240F1D83|nr:metalloregulator ArsR/SmtB family transcription factor [Caulobacter endophyticus]MDG2529637.1 metalloregulator ArsR/SmtB family transcription factor [Caulobacter endophyticus]